MHCVCIGLTGLLPCVNIAERNLLCVCYWWQRDSLMNSDNWGPACCLITDLSHKTYQIPKLKCFSFCLEVVFAQSCEACCLSREWRYSWINADRRCSDYIWVNKYYIAYECAHYIRGLTALTCRNLATAIFEFSKRVIKFGDFNTLRPRQNGRQYFTFLNAFSWMKIYIYQLKFHWSLFLSFELAIIQHWYR